MIGGISRCRFINFGSYLILTLLFFNQNPVDLAILEYTNPLKHATFTHRI